MTNEAVFQAERFDRLMKERGFTDGKLAYASGVSRSMIFYMRKGKRSKVSAEIIAAVAGPLGTSPQYLMGETADDSPMQKTMSVVAANIVELVDKLPPSKQREYRDLGRALLAAEDSASVETIYGELMERITRLAEIDGGEEALERLVTHLNSAAGRSPRPKPPAPRGGRQARGKGESIHKPAQGDS